MRMGTPRDTRYDFDNGWTYFGMCDVESDGHNAKMYHQLIDPDDNEIDINRFFGSYDVPSPKEVEGIIKKLK